ncbi:extracellular solute-binding protein [Methylocystis sp. 9N]|uniref:Extracellular solute-binding protein n=1 Tax=Methylocystis borbori TaxID=3118750 RepID=A0ABU7XCK9_9HYPH
MTVISVIAAVGVDGAAAVQAPTHGLALFGEPALPANFDHFPYANPQAPKGGRLRLGMRGSYDSLNPYNLKFFAAPQLLIGNVYQSLMVRSQDEPYTLYALVAQSVDIDDAREHVVFHLDPRARFADKTPIVADDVIFSFELLKAKGRPGQRMAFAQVKKFEALDAHTVRFDLTGLADREAPLVLAAMPVLSRKATDVEHFAETNMAIPTGSGPYVVKEAKAGARLVLQRDPEYWAKDVASQRGLYNFDEIDIEWYRDGGALFEALKAGLIDYREESSATRWQTGYDFPALREGMIVKDVLRPGRPVGMEGFVFNLRKDFFRDVRLREAIAMMFDFEWINANFYGGAYKRTVSYFDESEFSSSGRSASEAERAFLARFPGAVREDILEGRWRPPVHDGTGRDREIAKQAQNLLLEGGYQLKGAALEKDGKPIVFEIMIRDRDEERLALNFAASLKRIGITAEPRIYDEVQYQQRRQKFEYDMTIGQWRHEATPGQEQKNRWSSSSIDRESGVNLAGASSPALDALVDALPFARVKDEYIAVARALDRALLSGFYFVPLFHAGEIWTAHSAKLARPSYLPRFPMYPFGFTLETWWRKEP